MRTEAAASAARAPKILLVRPAGGRFARLGLHLIALRLCIIGSINCITFSPPSLLFDCVRPADKQTRGRSVWIVDPAQGIYNKCRATFRDTVRTFSPAKIASPDRMLLKMRRQAVAPPAGRWTHAGNSSRLSQDAGLVE
jgi:hypothetical protein